MENYEILNRYNYARKLKRYNKLKELHDKKLALKAMLDQRSDQKPITIEFLGLPGAGKTTAVTTISDFFTRGGYNVLTVPSASGDAVALKAKNLNLPADEYQKFVARKAFETYVERAKDSSIDIVIFDGGILENYLLQLSLTLDKTSAYVAEYESLLKDQKLDCVVAKMCTPVEALDRLYEGSIALEQLEGHDIQSIYAYESAFANSMDFINAHTNKFIHTHTDNLDADQSNVLIADGILDAISEKLSR